MSVKNILYGDMQELRNKLEKKGVTVREGKALCRAFRDKYSLTDKKTLDIAGYRI